ncbi:hypothetical protein J6590_035419 [Homalodisca vitripennis]|nr:hypothetical protein J6590_035419 [Homalodisca vitripennis]
MNMKRKMLWYKATNPSFADWLCTISRKINLAHRTQLTVLAQVVRPLSFTPAPQSNSGDCKCPIFKSIRFDSPIANTKSTSHYPSSIKLYIATHDVITQARNSHQLTRDERQIGEFMGQVASTVQA